MSLRRPSKSITSISSAIQHKLKENNRSNFNSILPLNKKFIHLENKIIKLQNKIITENIKTENIKTENKEKEKNVLIENINKENVLIENINKENVLIENINKEIELEKMENIKTENKGNKTYELNNQSNISINEDIVKVDEGIVKVDEGIVKVDEGIVKVDEGIVKVDEGKVEVTSIVKVGGGSGVGRVCGIIGVEKIYCINLQSCKERKDHMKREFSKNHFNATFINAIHPRHTEHKKKYTNPRFVDQGWLQPRCYCVQQACGHRPRKLRSTEVAISLSHNNIYSNIVNNNIKWSLVCEDDLVFTKNFCDIVNSVVPPEIWNHQSYKLSDDPDIKEEIQMVDSSSERPIIVFLGGARDNMGLAINDISQFKLKRMPNGVYSNYCYLINLEAAKFFSRKFYPITRPEDSFKRYWISKGRLDCYRISPSIIAELSAGTNMPSIYNRWSLGKVAPGSAGEPSKEYKPTATETNGPIVKKTRRKINYKKFSTKKIISNTKK
jgi:GR25 family glycosyltransferase involved in LPS biosynthesis